MDDKFPPLDLPLRPETWAYRIPQAFLGVVPTFSAMATPPAPSSDIWKHGNLATVFAPPPSGGILGQLTQLAEPLASQTGIRRHFGPLSCSRSRQQPHN